MDRVDRIQVTRTTALGVSEAKNPFEALADQLESALAATCISMNIDYTKFSHNFFTRLGAHHEAR